jgi:hypothetical protein
MAFIVSLIRAFTLPLLNLLPSRDKTLLMKSKYLFNPCKQVFYDTPQIIGTEEILKIPAMCLLVSGTIKID